MGSNARLGTTQFLVAEADDGTPSSSSRRSTNLDREHMDTYGDMEDVERAYLAFMDHVPFYGAVTACIDNPQLAAILPRAQRRVFTYGWPAKPTTASSRCRRIQVRSRTGSSPPPAPWAPSSPRARNAPGVLNATAAVAIGHQARRHSGKNRRGLHNFRGVDRRFQHRGTGRGIAVVDDYGHHPTEIRCTWPPRASATTNTSTSSSSPIATPAPPT